MKPNKRLTIERKRSVKDWEDVPENWQYVGSEWFEIMPLTGREQETAAQMQSVTTHRATCQYFSGANTSYRLRENDRVWNVLSVVNVNEANRHLEWRLAELAADG